jgi:hypothetical protein
VKNIKIINGTYGYRAPGVRAVEPKRPGDPPFPLADDKAERLVSLGVAEYADAPEGGKPAKPPKNGRVKAVATRSEGGKTGKAGVPPSGAETGAQSAGGGEGKPAYDADTKIDELRALMRECGLPYRVGMTKAEMVAALDEFFSEAGGDGGDDETPPDVGAEDPVT